MKVKITRVSTSEQINSIARLAREIWEQYFTPIIGSAQVDYMLGKFQSAGAIQAQIEAGASYYQATNRDALLAYAAVVPDRHNHKLMLNKLYVKELARGNGVGSELLCFVEQHCCQSSIKYLWLTVNRFNLASIAWYQRRGFTVVDEVNKDIGNGFFMDDFVMEKSLSR